MSPGNLQRTGKEGSAIWKWTKKPVFRKIFTLCRWVHVYLSTFLLCLLFFFCLTGVFLNHPEWTTSKEVVREKTYPLPPHLSQLLNAQPKPDLAAMENAVYQETGLSAPRKISVETDLGEWSFDYPLPAGYAFVILNRDSQTMTVEYQKGSLLGVLNDLHKGRHTGSAWSWVLDGSALLLGFMALTGLIILFQQAKWRNQGLALIVAGTLLPAAVYFFWVPSLF